MEQPLDLPNDIHSLHELVVKLQGKIDLLQSQKNHLQEQIRLLLHKRFGASTEKYCAQQGDLFNEAEAFAQSQWPTEREGTEMLSYSA
jgi:transposase